MADPSIRRCQWGSMCALDAAALPYVWIRRFILGSEGWGMAYAQNSTSGLKKGALVSKSRLACPQARGPNFFMMMNLKAFPRVWPSSRNSKEAAVNVEPGSC